MRAYAMIQGWCPGALRPMQSGDGLLVRLRISGGIVDTDLALEIARWSRRWGNGQIDLTGRANLQLRGLSRQHLPHLHEAMGEWALLDASPAGEAVRNVISSPLTGLDPDAVLDVSPIVRDLEQRLAGDAILHDLPGKFGFAIDDGGCLSLDGVPADVRFVARRGADGPEFDLRLAGAPNVGFGPCRADELVAVAVALALAFIHERKGSDVTVRRMDDLVVLRGAEAILRRAGLSQTGSSHSAGREYANYPLPSWPGVSGPPLPALAATGGPDTPGHDGDAGSFSTRTVMGAPAVIGAPAHLLAHQDTPGHDGGVGFAAGPTRLEIVPAGSAGAVDALPPERVLGVHNLGLAGYLGVRLPFGRIAAADLALLASAATERGARTLRLTPWRAILASVPSIHAAGALAADLRTESFILDPADPRCRVAACPGSPSCAHATTPVREDAARLANEFATLPECGTVLHVSGCAKGCAHPYPAPITLVASNGRYQLVRDGMPADAPELSGLTADQAAAQVRRIVAAWPGTRAP